MRLFEGDAEHLGDQLGNPVDIAVGQIEGPADIADDPARRHGAEGDDLADLVAAVLVGDVLDHLLAAVLAEVDVDIGHGDPLRIKETLEQQVVGDAGRYR